ncbi:hypothetical protein TPA0598_07_06010 [Streptomyces lydicamycinicus]|uniref:Uncharacterized protein n=1 Tax=Streptomyces lydicamycinicus TaxID=1546107 RepID=A0A0P4RBE2_9ACTN|nr:hypothetical protein TPA0598_07_06010 [Streptomyces lydicamycinicus]
MGPERRRAGDRYVPSGVRRPRFRLSLLRTRETASAKRFSLTLSCALTLLRVTGSVAEGLGRCHGYALSGAASPRGIPYGAGFVMSAATPDAAVGTQGREPAP